MARHSKWDKRKLPSGSFLLTVICAACREPVLLYQKDGRGGLLRIYLNRVLEPPALATLAESCVEKADVPGLVCESCGSVLGVPIVHGDGRLAWRVIPGRIVKQKGDRGVW